MLARARRCAPSSATRALGSALAGPATRNATLALLQKRITAPSLAAIRIGFIAAILGPSALTKSANTPAAPVRGNSRKD